MSDVTELVGDTSQLAQLEHADRLVRLAETLEVAELHFPYYAPVLRGAGLSGGRLKRLSELRRLPIMSRADLGEHRASLVHQAAEIAHIRCTGGTSGKRMPIFRTEAELDAVRAYYGAEESKSEGKDIILRVVPIGTRLAAEPYTARNALQLTMYYGVEQITTYRENYVDHLIRHLCDDYPVPGTAGRITVLHATPPFVARLVTEALEMRAFDAKSVGLRAIVCTGGHLTAWLRGRLESAWGCPVFANYSCTEINGAAANLLSDPSAYRFDGTCISEIVDPANPHGDGVSEGALALTTLYPFHEATLLLRYQNGDFVRRVDGGAGGFNSSFKFLGRGSHCLDLGIVGGSGEDRFVGSAEMQEAIEQLPEVPFVYYPRFRADLKNDGAFWTLLFQVEVYSIFGGRRDASVKETIAQRLVNCSPALRAAVGTGRLNIQVVLHQPDGLDHAFRLNP